MKEKYKYSVVCEEIESEYIGKYVSYGIEVSREGKTVCRVSDVSTDRDEIEELVRLCEAEELSVLHIYDVIEDFLGR